MNHMAYARYQIVSMLTQLHHIVGWVYMNQDAMSDYALMILAAIITQLSKYAMAAMTILNTPHIVQPVAGQRCIFY